MGAARLVDTITYSLTTTIKRTYNGNGKGSIERKYCATTITIRAAAEKRPTNSEKNTGREWEEPKAKTSTPRAPTEESPNNNDNNTGTNRRKPKQQRQQHGHQREKAQTTTTPTRAPRGESPSNNDNNTGTNFEEHKQRGTPWRQDQWGPVLRWGASWAPRNLYWGLHIYQYPIITVIEG